MYIRNIKKGMATESVQDNVLLLLTSLVGFRQILLRPKEALRAKLVGCSELQHHRLQIINLKKAQYIL
jgi:hypothetical protein